MNAIMTMVGVLIYLAGRLGPNGVVTGEVACAALLLAIVGYSMFTFIDFCERKFVARH